MKLIVCILLAADDDGGSIHILCKTLLKVNEQSSYIAYSCKASHLQLVQGSAILLSMSQLAITTDS